MRNHMIIERAFSRAVANITWVPNRFTLSVMLLVSRNLAAGFKVLSSSISTGDRNLWEFPRDMFCEQQGGGESWGLDWSGCWMCSETYKWLTCVFSKWANIDNGCVANPSISQVSLVNSVERLVSLRIQRYTFAVAMEETQCSLYKANAYWRHWCQQGSLLQR